ncbi:hypothetical protein QP547_00890 [Weeksella virosa]|uniref:hypothetical protein n=1 Tax=Weeksella virosa TaxID=1014 RepID=UPI002552E989|nr:hypothetical protein [Weeksella virosa]MDK7674366.1 hypothetical protein [Weeksella virosa]
MTQKYKNIFLIKASVHAAALLEEMDKANVDTEEARILKDLLERHLELVYQTKEVCDRPFLQTLENRFDTTIRITAKEFNIRL